MLNNEALISPATPAHYSPIPVILCGGWGSRLWPLSRSAYPKQFLKLPNSDDSLLLLVLKRLDALKIEAPPILVTNQKHKFLALEVLEQANYQHCSIIIEPENKNTAPAIISAALHSAHKHGNQPLWIMPADHLLDPTNLNHSLEQAYQLAELNYLVTFGIPPKSPHSGYGYILSGKQTSSKAHPIHQFIEKPPYDKAKKLLQHQNCSWNSGMFCFTPQAVLTEAQHYLPSVLSACKKAFEQQTQCHPFHALPASIYRTCPQVSFDHGIMEKTRRGAVVRITQQWNDIGSWDAFAQCTNTVDSSGNTIIGDVYSQKNQNCYIHAQAKFVAAIGLDNLCIIDTDDAILVLNKEKAQDVKSLVQILKKNNRQELEQHRKVHRPWGYYESLCLAPRFQVKRILVNPEKQLSLQQHYHRSEHWIIVSGTARITQGETQSTLTENQTAYIPLGVPHRLENPGKIPLEIIEVQTGEYLGEDDIVRLDDAYGRHTDNKENCLSR